MCSAESSQDAASRPRRAGYDIIVTVTGRGKPW